MHFEKILLNVEFCDLDFHPFLFFFLSFFTVSVLMGFVV